MKTNLIWKKGEEEAAKFLIDNGYTILERNWRGGHLEIDIICLDKYGIHFVEVKSRKAPSTADPEVGVTKRKQECIIAAAKKYLNSGKLISTDNEVHFDIITVLIYEQKSDIQYYPDAWYAIYV